MKLVSLLENMLNERYVNLYTPQEKLKYADEVWDILQKSYQKIGGFKSAENVQDLIDKSSLWKMVRKNDKIVAVAIYKDQRGRKSIAMGAEVGPDGKATKEGRDAIMSIIIEDIKLKRSWSEVSGAAEHLKVKQGATRIPNKYAAELTGKEIIELNPDGYHYIRMIAGKPYEKIIVGYIEGLNIDDTRK